MSLCPSVFECRVEAINWWEPLPSSSLRPTFTHKISCCCRDCRQTLSSQLQTWFFVFLIPFLSSVTDYRKSTRIMKGSFHLPSLYLHDDGMSFAIFLLTGNLRFYFHFYSFIPFLSLLSFSTDQINSIVSLLRVSTSSLPPFLQPKSFLTTSCTSLATDAVSQWMRSWDWITLFITLSSKRRKRGKSDRKHWLREWRLKTWKPVATLIG